MPRLLCIAGGLVAVAGLAACGASAAATSSGAAASPTAGRGQARNGTAGEVVKVGSSSLVLNTSGGDVTVSFTSTTPVAKSTTGSLGDVVVGSCLTALGKKDSAGNLAVSTVRLNQPVNGSCAAPPGGGSAPSGSGAPQPSGSPGAGRGNAAGARGQVTAVNGTSVTLKAVAGNTQTLTIPTTASISTTATAAISDITVGTCVRAVGSKDSSGNVSAKALAISPAGPNGCFTGGGGGFPGGGRGNGGGNGGASAGSSPTGG